MRAHDGRPGGSGLLLARAQALFGPVTGLPGRPGSRSDRPAVLASFAPEVAGCLRPAEGDAVAESIVGDAARHVADAAAAVCPPGPSTVALTGGLFRVGEVLLSPLRAALAERLPEAVREEAAGSPLDGALVIASALAGGRLSCPRTRGCCRSHALWGERATVTRGINRDGYRSTEPSLGAGVVGGISMRRHEFPHWARTWHAPF